MPTKNQWIQRVGGAVCWTILLLCVAGCGQRPHRVEMTVPVDEQLFARAEAQFEAKQLDAALATYGDLVVRFPKSGVAAPSLLKQGVIYGIQGAYKEAEAVLARVTQDYPTSPFAPVAWMESLELSYRMEDYSGVIRKGRELPDTLSPPDYRVRKYAIMGDAYLALDQGVDAVAVYFKACDLLYPAECGWVMKRLYGAVAGLTRVEVEDMLLRTPGRMSRGYLLFRQMVTLADEGRVDDSLQAARDFLNLYDAHPVRGEVVALLEALDRAHYDPRVVGFLLPFTGRYADYGRQAREGIELAFQGALTEEGGEAFRLIFRDTESSDEGARRGVRELVDEGAAVIIGPVGNVESATDEAQFRGVPMITMTGKDGIAASGDFIFRNFMTPRMQVRSVVAYAFEVLGINDFAILYPDEPYGRDFMNLFWDEVARYGGEIRGVEAYGSGIVDFAAPIKKLTGLWYNRPSTPTDPEAWGRVFSDGAKDLRLTVDFEAIFVPDGSKNLEMLLPQLAYHDLGGIYTLGTNLWHDDALMEGASKYLGHSIIPDGFFVRSRDPHVRRFVTAFKAAFDREPGYIGAVAFDSASLVLDLLGRHSPATRRAVRDALLAVNGFAGVTGSTSFDGNGEVDKGLSLLMGKGRHFVEVPR